MSKPPKNGRELLAVHVPQGMMTALRLLAHTNRRPLAWQVVIVLEEGLKQLGVTVEKGELE